REGVPIPGAAEFVERLTQKGRPFLILTNNSIYTPRDLAARLNRAGIEVTEDHIWTSALATARFLQVQMPGASVFVIGETGLHTALHQAGFVMTDNDPDLDRKSTRLNSSHVKISH